MPACPRQPQDLRKREHILELTCPLRIHPQPPPVRGVLGRSCLRCRTARVERKLTMAAEKPVILLVHDAFHRPEHYEAVLGPLRDKGYTVVAPSLPTTGENPGTTFIDDMAVINQDLQPLLDQGKEVIIAAHGFGTLPASQCVEGESVAERTDCGLEGGIRHYINVCGLAYPYKGRSILGTESDFPIQEYHLEEDGLIHLLDTAKPILYNDLTAEQVDSIWPTIIKTHSSENIHSFPNFVDMEFHSPKTYIFCENDIALATEYQAYFVGVGEYDDVIRIPAGHSPWIKMPDQMVKIICDIAEKP